MSIYAGIDEAGYGPMFGPFVIARSVFAVNGESAEAGEAEPEGRAEDRSAGVVESAGGEPPDLWRCLERAVCRKARDKRKRIAVDDSKKLYSPSGGLANLERAVLSFAKLAGHEPRTLEELLACVGHDAQSRIPDLLWYHHGDEPDGALPAAWTADELTIAAGRLRRCAEESGAAATDLAAAVIYEDRFNRIVEATRSKARCAWTFVAQHLWAIWEAHGAAHPWVAVDRQSGRKVYHELLQLIFEGAEIRLLDESADISRYVVSDQATGRAMTVSFECDADSRHLPVALASMTAKYVRELLMGRFNRFWLDRAAEPVKPTAGYAQDGRRFLGEIEPVIRRLNIDRDLLVRKR